MKRGLESYLQRDLSRKIVLITGPRQCGKTTLAQMLSEDHDYLDYDYAEHRIAIREKSWDRKKKIIIFDELHKMKDWKAWRKGIYDVEGLSAAVAVTGSARMDTGRKTGDSLAGRYFTFIPSI